MFKNAEDPEDSSEEEEGVTSNNDITSAQSQGKPRRKAPNQTKRIQVNRIVQAWGKMKKHLEHGFKTSYWPHINPCYTPTAESDEKRAIDLISNVAARTDDEKVIVDEFLKYKMKSRDFIDDVNEQSDQDEEHDKRSAEDSKLLEHAFVNAEDDESLVC